MSQVFSTIITHYGAALEATSKAQGTPISLTALAVGDGNGQVVNPGANAQSLTGEVWRGGINHMYVDPDNPEWTIIEAYIPETTGGFTLREIGVFAEPDILYAVGRTPEIYKPVLSEGASLGLLLRVIVKISSEAHPVLLIDPSKVMATREFVQQELAENSEADRDFSQNLVDQETAILSAHISDIDAHGASVPPAAGSIVLRDSGGRVKSAEPVAAEDVVRLFDKYDLCEFYYFRHPTLKPGFQSAQGGLLTNAATLYPEAWAYLQTTEGQLLCKTEAEWQAMTTAIWHTNADGTTAGWNGIGGAPFYAPDLATGALRLP
ncbi:MAG: phage tail protein, partial [Deltaproteobacteria bacterium]|nr:phage tail protein [Deltaproteobacteria bacterium]